jgi:predicted HTH domain antitoxin
VSVVIPDDVLAAARMSEDELKLELAVLLFEKKS